MARISKITKEEIIASAFKICDTNGVQSLTVRTIASNLGTSTAPIYTQFDNMEAISLSLSTYINEQLNHYMEKELTLDPFLNIGAGTIAFVLEHPLIFRDFYINKGYSILQADSIDKHIKQMSSSPFLGLLGRERLASLLEDMSIYTMGLTLTICNAHEDRPLAYYISKLEATGSRLINYHMISSGNLENSMNLLMKKISEQTDIKSGRKSGDLLPGLQPRRYYHEKAFN